MKKTLYEFDPGTLWTGFRYGVVPAVSNGLSSAVNTVKVAAKNAKRNKKSLYKNIVHQLSKSAKKDPTLFGDAVRTGELGRQLGGVVTLQNLPPLPTPDSQSIRQTGDALANVLTRGETKGKIYNTFKKVGMDAGRAPKTMKKALSDPLKSAKDLVVDRATLSTYQGSPMTNYSSPLFGIVGPVVDNNSIMMSFYKSGLSPQDFLKHLYTYNKTAYYQAKELLPQMVKNFKSKIMSFGDKIKSTILPAETFRIRNLNPLYQT